MQKKACYSYHIFIFCIITLSILTPSFVAGDIDDKVFLINSSEDYLKYGFKDYGYYYTSEALTVFYMPLVVEKNPLVDSLSMKDLTYNIPVEKISNEKNFNNRNPNIEYKILDENSKYILVLAEMHVKASTDPFSIDFVPTIKEHSIDKFAWWNSSWGYKKNITLDHNQVNSNLSNFPVLINITDTDLKNISQSDGDDICFTDGIETTQLNHEIEYYDNTTGRLVAWVNVTNLSSSSDTYIYMYYGNDACSSQEDVAGTWDSNYVYVLHMDNATSTTISDSTSNNYTGTKLAAGQPAESTGIIAKSQLFDSDNDKINMNGKHMPLGAKTVTCWFNISAGTDLRGIIDCTGFTTARYGVDYFVNTNDKLYAKIARGLSGNPIFELISSATVDDSTWHHSAWTWDGTTNANKAILYMDGAVDDTDTALQNETHASSYNDCIGNDASGAHGLAPNGALDEIRVSNIARSSDWINTEYNTMNNASNGGFFTMGTASQSELLQFSNYNPSVGATGLCTDSVTKISVYIYDYQGDTFNWSIETSPDIGTNSSNGSSNGTKNCSVSNLQYGTTYTVFINATDLGSGNWVRFSYVFSTIGGITFYCYNETNPLQCIDFDILISNQEGTETYAETGMSCGGSINTSVMPIGDNTIFIVSNSSYESRVYYYDITPTTYLNTSFYLPPKITNESGTPVDTVLYRMRVIDNYAYPIADATITVKRYINESDGYETVTVLASNGYGEADCYLVPDTNYKYIVSKTGFNNLYMDDITDPDYYGANYPIILQISYYEPDDSVYGFWDCISFNATMYDNNTIRVVYEDRDSNTTSAVFTTYESYNGTFVLNATNSTTDNSFIFWITGVNTSRQHIIYCDLIHSKIGTATVSIIVLPLRTSLTSLDYINTVFGNILGDWNINTGGLGYVEFFFIFIPFCVVALIPATGKDKHHGAGIFIGGLWLGFSCFVVFDEPVVTVGLCLLICSIGIILEAIKGGIIKL